jgi:hypothetical protein
MRRTGRTLTAGFLVLTGTGFLLLSGTGIAHAEPAGAPAPATCSKLLATTTNWTATLKANEKKFTTDHAAYVAAVDNYGNEVTEDVSQGSPALRAAAKTFVTDLETEIAAEDFDAARINADSNRLNVLACTPAGAPATGGGSSAAVQDPGLFVVGGAAALGGFVVVGRALRSRPRTSVARG